MADTQENNKQETTFLTAVESLDSVLMEKSQAPKLGTGTGVAEPREIDTVIKTIVNLKKMPNTTESYNKVLVTCAIHCQQGATSPKYAESRVVTEHGVSLKVSEFRAALKTAGTTARKFARGIRGVIVKVSKHYELEGNLSKSYKLENPNFDPQDLPWVSDFQTFNDDPAMPSHVKQWLLENYRKRFRPNLIINNKQQPIQEAGSEI